MKRIIAYVAVLALALVTVACVGGSKLAGLWVGDSPNDLQLELNEDGTGTMTWGGVIPDSFDMTWEEQDGLLCLTDDGDNEQCIDYALDGDRLTITFEDTTILMERWPDTEEHPGRDAVGRWQTGSDEWIDFSGDGEFTLFLNQETISGEWELANGEICLDADSSDDFCFRYAPGGRTLTIDGSIFVRQ